MREAFGKVLAYFHPDKYIRDMEESGTKSNAEMQQLSKIPSAPKLKP